MYLSTQNLGHVDIRKVDEQEDELEHELIDNEVLRIRYRFLWARNQVVFQSRTTKTRSEVESAMRDNNNTAVAVTTRCMVTGIVEETMKDWSTIFDEEHGRN